MSIPTALPTVIERGLAGKPPTPSAKFCWASKGNANIARSLNFIIILKASGFSESSQRKTSENRLPFGPIRVKGMLWIEEMSVRDEVGAFLHS